MHCVFWRELALYAARHNGLLKKVTKLRERNMGETIAATLPDAGFLSRERTIADSAFNRWLVPPAALAIHLCIGMAYGFSVFWLPLSRAIGSTRPLACPAGSGILDALFT